MTISSLTSPSRLFAVANEGGGGNPSSRVKTAVIPVAGDGTRMFPVSLPFQKNLTPVGPKSLIQYAVEEAIEAGCEKIILVHGPEDRQQYKRAFGIDVKSSVGRKMDEKESVKNIIESLQSLGGHITFLTQDQPLGLGHAILEAEDYIDGSPFLVILPDDLILEGLETNASKSMVAAYQSGISVAAMPVSSENIKNYGCFVPSAGGDTNADIFRASAMVEKPSPEDAPSNIAAIGRYILPRGIMGVLHDTPKGVGGEIQLTDAIKKMAEDDGTAIYATRFAGTRFDCGTHEGFMEASMHVAALSMGRDRALEIINAAFPDQAGLEVEGPVPST